MKGANKKQQLINLTKLKKMKKELKQAILNFIIDNENTFQLNNHVINNFKEYIYTSKGDYLIGGEDVSKFISNAITLLRTA